jgi:signal transduction histidine kinase
MAMEQGRNQPDCQAPWKTFPEMDAAVQLIVKKYEAHVRQLKLEILTRREENDAVIAENLRQNEELRSLNQELDQKVKDRTSELMASKEAVVAQNQKLQELSGAKEALMHMVVHDMKNPLTAIIGTLGLCRGNRLQIAPDVKSLLVDAHVQSVKLLCMVDEILTISRMQSKEFEVHPEPMDMIALVHQSMSMMSLTLGGKKVALRFSPAETEIFAMADYQTIERTLNNLVNNAIKYAPPESEVWLDVARQDRTVEVGVTNWGHPIPAECHEKIFDQFYRVQADVAKYSGTGLGLTFCRLAIQAHGGTIGVVSPVPPQNIGARFFFTLPLAAKPPEPPAGPAACC